MLTIQIIQQNLSNGHLDLNGKITCWEDMNKVIDFFMFETHVSFHINSLDISNNPNIFKTENPRQKVDTFDKVSGSHHTVLSKLTDKTKETKGSRFLNILKQCKLRKINLTNTPISDDTLIALSQNKELLELFYDARSEEAKKIVSENIQSNVSLAKKEVVKNFQNRPSYFGRLEMGGNGPLSTIFKYLFPNTTEKDYEKLMYPDEITETTEGVSNHCNSLFIKNENDKDNQKIPDGSRKPVKRKLCFD